MSINEKKISCRGRDFFIMTLCFLVIVFLNHINVGQSKCDQDDAAKAQSKKTNKQYISLSVTEDKKFYIDKQPVSFEELETTLMSKMDSQRPNSYCENSI
jgi:biopolymer transport protein ExbD